MPESNYDVGDNPQTLTETEKIMNLEETLDRYLMDPAVRDVLVEIEARVKNPDSQNWAVWFVEVDNSYQRGESGVELSHWDTLSGYTEVVHF